MPMPREDPAAAATTAATSVMTWNAGVSLVLQLSEYSTAAPRTGCGGGERDKRAILFVSAFGNAQGTISTEGRRNRGTGRTSEPS